MADTTFISNLMSKFNGAWAWALGAKARGAALALDSALETRLLTVGGTEWPTATPDEITSLVRWYKADTLALADGVAVSSWACSAGSGVPLAQVTGSLQPLYRSSGDGLIGTYPTVQGDGTDDYLIAALNGTAYTGLTVALVFKAPDAAWGNETGLFQWAAALTSPSPFLMLNTDSSAATNVRCRVFFDGAYPASYACGRKGVVVVVVRWTGFFVDIAVNDREEVRTSAEHPSDVTAPANQANGTSIYLFNGYNGYTAPRVAELAIWNRGITNWERTKLINGFLNKYRA